MSVVNGTVFELVVNGNTVGKSKSAGLMLRQDLPDATTKDDNGWSKHIFGIRDGEVAINSLSASSEAVNFGTFTGYIFLKTLVEFSFKSNDYQVTGTATVKDAVEVSEAENVVSYDITLKIKGAVIESAIGNEFLLLEDGFYFLLESGDKLILEEI